MLDISCHGHEPTSEQTEYFLEHTQPGHFSSDQSVNRHEKKKIKKNFLENQNDENSVQATIQRNIN